MVLTWRFWPMFRPADASGVAPSLSTGPLLRGASTFTQPRAGRQPPGTLAVGLMRLSSRLGYADGFVRAVERAVRLEEIGVDVVWVAEAYGFDAVSRLGYLAARTRRMQLGSAILNIYSRTPALLAQTAAGLDEISGGRAILGIGASGPQVIEGFHGVAYDRPVQRTREIIEICRMVWRRDILDYHGKAVTLPLPPDRGAGLGKPLKI